MTGWERFARPRVLVAVVVLVLVTTMSAIVVHTELFDELSAQVEQAQARAANLSNADRETLLLLQLVTRLPASIPRTSTSVAGSRRVRSWCPRPPSTTARRRPAS